MEPKGPARRSGGQASPAEVFCSALRIADLQGELGAQLPSSWEESMGRAR